MSVSIKYVNMGYLVGENIEKFERIKKAISKDFKERGIKERASNGDCVAILMRLGFDEAARVYHVDISDL